MIDRRKTRVVIGMSGGVDSSVAALLLKQQGYDVIGLFMKNWEEDGYCPAERDYQDALYVAETLNIPLHTMNFTQEYREEVFADFLLGLQKGITPNPDVLCNREIKFKHFFTKAEALGASYIATGHYCRVDKQGTLYKGIDSNKDQSYFLHAVKREQLKKTLFPVGDFYKPDLRAIAKKHHLITHDKKDSTGICFIGKRNFASFIEEFIPSKKGSFVTTTGKVVGEHRGAWLYTIGQRKGLSIGGAGDAWFVVDKDIATNIVTVVQGENHPALFGSVLFASDTNWFGDFPAHLPYACKAKTRYRQEEVDCFITQREQDTLKVSFAVPQRAITPGQSIVFYQDDLCLGGALIGKEKESVNPSTPGLCIPR